MQPQVNMSGMDDHIQPDPPAPLTNGQPVMVNGHAEPLTDAIVNVPAVIRSNDPRLNRRPVPNPMPNGIAPVAPVQIPAAVVRKPKKVIIEKQTQFYDMVTNNGMQFNYMCEVKPKPHHREAAGSEAHAAINSIDFDPDGNFLAASTGDDSIIVLDLKQQVPGKVIIPCKKYGANLIKMLNNHTAVHSSTRTDTNANAGAANTNGLRWLDLANHKYIRYFNGHVGLVCSLDVTANARTIISAAAVEKKVLLWDVDQCSPTACLKLQTESIELRKWDTSGFGNEVPNMMPRTIALPQPVVTFDPTNTVFAVACRETSEYIRLYDRRNFSKGPFKTWNYNLVDRIYECFPKGGSLDARMCAITALSSDFTDIKFSPNGRIILINTSGPYFYLFDAFTGKLKRTILRGEGRTYKNDFAKPAIRAPEVSFTPDSEYLIGGNGSPSDPRIYCWSVRSGKVIAILRNNRRKGDSSQLNLAVNYVRHNPVNYTIASAGGQRISLFRSVRPDEAGSGDQRKDHEDEHDFSEHLTF
jgi:COMPASS component SWD2